MGFSTYLIISMCFSTKIGTYLIFYYPFIWDFNLSTYYPINILTFYFIEGKIFDKSFIFSYLTLYYVAIYVTVFISKSISFCMFMITFLKLSSCFCNKSISLFCFSQIFYKFSMLVNSFKSQTNLFPDWDIFNWVEGNLTIYY